MQDARKVLPLADGVLMMKTQVLCSTYKKLNPFRKIPYWVFWLSLGTTSYFLGDLLIRLFNERGFFVTQMFFAGCAGTFPIVIEGFSQRFQETMRSLSAILWNDKTQFEEWLTEHTIRLFTLSSWPARIITSGVTLLALATVFLLGMPFRSTILNCFALFGFVLLLIICGQGVYMLLSLLITIRQITHRQPNVPFYRLPHPAITELSDQCALASLLIGIAYIALVIAISQGPYGFSVEMQSWLAALAFFPISMFFWSLIQVRTLMRNVKQSQLDIINAEIERNLQRVLNGEELEVVQRLEKVMEIQSRIQAIQEWPIAAQGAVAFIVTFTTLAVQIISLMRAVGP